MTIDNIKTLFLDGDGVLWHADTPSRHLIRFFETVKSRGISWALLSNNASLSIDEFVKKFQGFGIDAEPSNIVNSTVVTNEYLKGKYASGSLIYAVGTKSMRSTLSMAGYEIMNGSDKREHVAAVVVGIDREFNYEKLSIASSLIRAGAEFIATNTDSTYPTAHGLEPGAGSIVAALSVASGQKPVVMGKPLTTMFDVALRQVSAERASTWMVGDRMETDVLGAKAAGIRAVLVLSGVATRHDAALGEVKPDLIVDDIGALADEIRRT